MITAFDGFASVARLTWSTVFFVFCVSILSACATGISGSLPLLQPAAPVKAIEKSEQDPRPLQQQATIKIGLMLPLTAEGQTAYYAQALKQAAELALFEFNNPNILLITKDSKGTLSGARKAAKAVIREEAEVIIGPLFAKSVVSAAAIARQANVPIIAFSSDRSVAGNGVYLLSFLAGREIPRIVSYTAHKGRRNFAALVPDTAYGRVIEAKFRQSVDQAGGRVITVESYTNSANGLLEPMRKLARIAQNPAQKLEALLIPEGHNILPSAAPLIQRFGIDTKQVKLIGTQQWNFQKITQLAPFIGGWFPASNPKEWQEFSQSYNQTYGSYPPKIASLAYDGVSLAVSLSNNPPENRYTLDKITRPSGFSGIDGLFRILKDGTPDRGFAILEVANPAPHIIDTAPNHFNAAHF